MQPATERLKASDYVRGARAISGKTQMEFAISIGSTQPMISKYESGEVDPPTDLLMRCMHIMLPDSIALITESRLVALVQERLSGDLMAQARATLARLIELLAPEAGAR